MDVLRVKINGEWVGIPAIQGEQGHKGDKGEPGQDGQDGVTPNVTVGTTTTGAAGTSASVTRRSGSPDSAPIFDFVIPKGDKGEHGDLQLDSTLTSASAAAPADQVGNLKSAFDEISTKETISTQTVSYYTTPWTVGGGINPNGVLVEVDSWGYTDKISVVPGDVVTCDALENNVRISRPIRYLCAYNNDTPVPSAGSSSEISSYTVPEGVTHLVVTMASVNYYTGLRVINTRDTTHYVLWLEQDKIGGFRQTGDLGSGEEFVFPITNIKQYKVFCFSGNITSFTGLKMGRKGSSDIESVTIDGTNLTITNTYGTETVAAHGLTISDNLQVLLVSTERNRLNYIRITSLGNSFEYKQSSGLNNITWNGDIGYPFVRSISSVFTDCVASWTSKKIDSPIWMFGDSYMTYDSARWPYYLIQDGFDKECLMNAYAGENSENAMVAFNSLINAGLRPKYIVWALGMNDGDSNNDAAPNGNWQNAVNSVISVCNARGIKLVLCTIPTTPNVNNNYKNAWIKASGYRYIDYAAAVGATTEGVWFTGLLSTDKVHPTAEGAKTLYYRLLSDFPEICIDN